MMDGDIVWQPKPQHVDDGAVDLIFTG